jgi:hypothetical protein
MNHRTLKKYMPVLGEAVDKKIEAMLPKKFSQVFDFWSSRCSHYIASLAAAVAFFHELNSSGGRDSFR